MNMKRRKEGFTIVEMALFLAITGLLFVGIIAGTYGAIRRQRYNDSVQSFANLWRDIYSEVSNTQNYGGYGNTEEAIYGKLVVFGEEMDLSGQPLDEYSRRQVFIYDVIANATSDVGTGDTIEMLGDENMNVNVLYYETSTKRAYVAGLARSYAPTWGGVVQNTGRDNSNNQFKGSVLVVRHPGSGAIGTFYYDGVINVNEFLDSGQTQLESPVKELLSSKIKNFEQKEITFCINSDDIGMNTSLRQGIVIEKGAHSSAGVSTLSFDNVKNDCTK